MNRFILFYISRMMLNIIILSVIPYISWCQQSPVTFEDYLRDSIVPKETLDIFLDPNEPSWAQFDSETGYVVGNYMPRDGIDQSSTISTSQQNRARKSHLYTDQPCRINTYGNSFTQCHQVSDGETWQEYLAAHLGEPIRNFGVGGYGVYQTYRRMLQEEQLGHNAEYIIFYIWGDDHLRSLWRCRHVAIRSFWDHQGGRMFHNNFWSNIDIDLETGRFHEHENILNTPESVYKMCDPEWMVENLNDDFALEMYLYTKELIHEIDSKKLKQLAGLLHVPLDDFTSSNPSRSSVEVLLNEYGFSATQFILEKTKKYIEQNNKKLLIVLFDPYRVMKQLANGQERADQDIVDYLNKNNYTYFDMNDIHLQDYQNFNLSFDAYMKRYFIGHYNPRGNHFFAYTIKDTVVSWLEPKPVTYESNNEKMIHFKGYLTD